jgi:hypothetical protein
MRPSVLVGAVLAVALLAGVVPAGPATAQAAPRPDLAVTQFVRLGPAPGWTNGTPNSTTLQVTIANLGSAPASYRIDYSWVDSNGTRPLNEDASSSVDVGGPLAPESHYSPPPVQWRLQPGEVGDGVVTAQVRAYAADQTTVADHTAGVDADPSNDARGIPLFVAVHQIRFDMTTTPAEAPPDGVGFFRVTARNDGNVQERVSVRLVDPPKDTRLHATVDPEALAIPPGTTSNVTLFVDYVPAGDFSPFSLHYSLQADPGFGAPVRLTTPALTGGPETADTAGYSFHLAAAPSTLLVPRGGEGVARLRLANDGTRPDAYRFDLSADPGWTLSTGAMSGAGSRVALYPGEQTAVPLHVVAPGTAPPGSTTRIEVRAHASRLPTPASGTIEAEVPGAILAIEALGLKTASVYTGDLPQVLVTVANQGTQEAPAGSGLYLAVDLEGTPHRFLQATLDRLAPGDSSVEAFDLPAFAAGGTANIAVLLQDTQGNTAARRSIDILVHDASVVLQAPQPMAGGPGELVAYRIAPHAFRITNLGNAPERILLEAHAAVGNASVEGDTEIEVAPTETRTFAVDHVLPRPLGGRNVANLTVVARLADRPDRTWQANASTSLRDEESPRLWSTSKPPLAWPLDTPLPLDLVAHDDDGVRSVRATSTDPRGRNTTVDLAAAGADHWTGMVVLRFPGNHTISVMAKDLAGNARNLTFTVEARRDLPPPRLSLQGPGNGTIGNGSAFRATQSLRLQVEDDTGVAQASLEIDQGSRVIRRNLSLASGVASFDLRDATPGDADVRIQAINAAGLASNLTIHVHVLPSAIAVASDPVRANRHSPAFLAGTLAAVAAVGVLRRRRLP